MDNVRPKELNQLYHPFSHLMELIYGLLEHSRRVVTRYFRLRRPIACWMMVSVVPSQYRHGPITACSVHLLLGAVHLSGKEYNEY